MLTKGSKGVIGGVGSGLVGFDFEKYVYKGGLLL